MALLPAKRQSLFFSATFPPAVAALADRLLHEPRVIDVAPPVLQPSTIVERAIEVDALRRTQLLRHLVQENGWSRTFVFVATKYATEHVAEKLRRAGIDAGALHGELSQGGRTEALAHFKAGRLRVLVATDLAARGLDIDDLAAVVNYDLPRSAVDYVHRIGRTGRAGATGEAVSLVCLDEEIFLRDIEKLIKRAIPRETIPGFEPPAGEKAEPIVLGRMTIGIGGTRRGGGGGGGGGGRGGRPQGAGGRPSGLGGSGGRSPSSPGQRPAAGGGGGRGPGGSSSGGGAGRGTGYRPPSGKR